MGTKNNPGDFDCYLNAEPDEPMFILLGRDRHAADVVSYWISLREDEGTTDPTKLTEAKACIRAMQDYWYTRSERDA